MKLRIEFSPIHHPGSPSVTILCGGDDGCGSAVIDTHRHLKWHEKMFPYDVPLPKSGPTITGK